VLSYHEDHHRISHAMVYGDNNADEIKTIKAVAAEEQLAEQVRLLYVGLTRAQYYCWVCCGAVNKGNTSGLSSLLYRNEKNEIKTLKQEDVLRRLETIAVRDPNILLEPISRLKSSLPVFRHETDFASITTANPATHLQLDWRVLSFSQLTHDGHHQGPVASAAADEVETVHHLASATEEKIDRRFSGIAFGNALHHALENADVQVWRAQAGLLSTPESELPLLQQALLRQGYAPDELDAGTQQLTALVANTLKVRLPEGIRLCDLPENARLNEMEFARTARDSRPAER